MTDAALGILEKVVDFFVWLLPTSPFQTFIKYFSNFKYLPYINYFLPVDMFVAVLESYLTAVVLWYIVQFINGIISQLTS